MGLSDLIAGGMDVPPPLNYCLMLSGQLSVQLLFTLCRLDLQCVKPDLPEQKILEIY